MPIYAYLQNEVIYPSIQINLHICKKDPWTTSKGNLAVYTYKYIYLYVYLYLYKNNFVNIILCDAYIRSLDKIKKQIKAAKEEKRRVRDILAKGGDPLALGTDAKESGTLKWYMYITIIVFILVIILIVIPIIAIIVTTDMIVIPILVATTRSNSL